MARRRTVRIGFMITIVLLWSGRANASGPPPVIHMRSDSTFFASAGVTASVNGQSVASQKS